NQDSVISANHSYYRQRYLYCEGSPRLLFTENESNAEKLWNSPNRTPYVKDAFHEYVIAGKTDAVNPAQTGTKASAVYELQVPAGQSAVIRLRLTDGDLKTTDPFSADFDKTFAARKK